jgi:uncharacterized membrane protein
LRTGLPSYQKRTVLPGTNRRHGACSESTEREVGTDYHNDNVETLAALHAHAQRKVSEHQRRIERVTAQVGRPRTFYLLLGFTAFWIAANLVLPILGGRALDPPPFTWLQGVVGFVALLMTTTVLITQNRQTSHAEQRAQIDLQVNLMAEQKVAKLIALMEELRRDLPSVRDRVDRVAETMKEPVDPQALLSALEQTLEAPTSSVSASSQTPRAAKDG